MSIHFLTRHGVTNRHLLWPKLQLQPWANTRVLAAAADHPSDAAAMRAAEAPEARQGWNPSETV